MQLVLGLYIKRKFNFYLFFIDNGGSCNFCEEVYVGIYVMLEIEIKYFQNFLCSYSNLIVYLNVYIYG